TSTATRAAGELQDATGIYTVGGDDTDAEPDYDQAAEALDRAIREQRKLVGDQLQVRFDAAVSFEFDARAEASPRKEELLARARARDEELAKLKENAKPAGEANPYKTESE